jgi:hypothetical protein
MGAQEKATSAPRNEDLNEGWTPDVAADDQISNLMTKVRREVERKFENGGIQTQKPMGDTHDTKYTGRKCCRSLSPLEPAMRRWDVVTVLLLVFTAVVTPFEIAFLTSSVDGLFFVNRFVDIGFLSDMFINFRLAYLSDTGAYEFSPAKIWVHYCKGWFFLDLVSLIPWDCIAMIVEANTNSGEVQDLKVLRLLKILKLTKMIRIMKSASIFKRLQTELGMHNTTKQLIKNGILILATVHWTACGWGMIAAYDDSWITRFEERKGIELPTYDVYALSLEYALTVMCMSYATIMPETSVERWFSLVAMLIAGFVYVFVIGGICSAIAAEDSATMMFKENVDTLMLFFRNIALPNELKMRAFDYLNYCENLLRDDSHRDVLMIMPQSIRGDICTFQHSGIVSRIPFLQKCFKPVGNGNAQTGDQAKLLSFICLKLSQKAYPPQEVIYLRNDAATDVFIITRGVVKISGGFIKVPQFLSKGANFGSDMLMTPDPLRVHAVKSVSYSTHSLLSAEDLLELQVSKPALFEIASGSIQLHRNILKTAYTMQKFGKMVCDEIRKEVATKDCMREVAAQTVTARFRKQIYEDSTGNDGNDGNDCSDGAAEAASENNRGIAECMAERIEGGRGVTPKDPSRSIHVPKAASTSPLPLPELNGSVYCLSPGGDAEWQVPPPQSKQSKQSEQSKQSKIVVNGVANERVTADDLRGVFSGDADSMPLADLFALQQKVKAQSAEWRALFGRLKTAIQLQTAKDLGDRDKQARARAQTNGKQSRTSFAD